MLWKAWVWLAVPLAGLAVNDPYQKEIAAWRVEREENLKKDGSWLTVAGLYWLRPGESTVGTGPENDFVLPERTAPERVGTFDYQDGKVTFRAHDGVEVVQKGKDGKPVTTAQLEPGEKNALAIGNLSMWVHASGPRLAIRLRDLDSPIRKQFTGLAWFEIDPEYRVDAKFTPHQKPKDVELLNMLGDIEHYQSPGIVDFELKGEAIRMEPVLDTDGSLWFIFKDGTSGKETYPSARFLKAPAPREGQTVVDFNKAYNPPCAFNPYTTCPMPQKENRLKVRVEAGEKYRKHS